METRTQAKKSWGKLKNKWHDIVRRLVAMNAAAQALVFREEDENGGI
jgi:hypothetical protein